MDCLCTGLTKYIEGATLLSYPPLVATLDASEHFIQSREINLFSCNVIQNIFSLCFSICVCELNISTPICSFRIMPKTPCIFNANYCILAQFFFHQRPPGIPFSVLLQSNRDCKSKESGWRDEASYLVACRVFIILSVSFPAGRSATLWAHVEGELRPHPDGPRSRPGPHRAGPEAGGPAPNEIELFILEGLQEAERT